MSSALPHRAERFTAAPCLSRRATRQSCPAGRGHQRRQAGGIRSIHARTALEEELRGLDLAVPGRHVQRAGAGDQGVQVPAQAVHRLEHRHRPPGRRVCEQRLPLQPEPVRPHPRAESGDDADGREHAPDESGHGSSILRRVPGRVTPSAGCAPGSSGGWDRAADRHATPGARRATHGASPGPHAGASRTAPLATPHPEPSRAVPPRVGTLLDHELPCGEAPGARNPGPTAPDAWERFRERARLRPARRRQRSKGDHDALHDDVCPVRGSRDRRWPDPDRRTRRTDRRRVPRAGRFGLLLQPGGRSTRGREHRCGALVDRADVRHLNAAGAHLYNAVRALGWKPACVQLRDQLGWRKDRATKFGGEIR